MLLSDNENKKILIKDKLKSVFSELLTCEDTYALEYVQWTFDKLLVNKKHMKEMDLREKLKKLDINKEQVKIKQIKEQIKKILPVNYPNSLEIGDIVHTKFGVGFSGELSDNHYSIILSRKGSMFLIAPLTKTFQPDGANIKYFENLGLPGEMGKSYVNFGQIRYIHFRRIEKIIGIENGKKNIGIVEVNNIIGLINAIIVQNNSSKNY